MAKAAKTAIKTKDQKAAAEAKNWTKVVKAVRSPKTGAYTFKEQIVHKDKSFPGNHQAIVDERLWSEVQSVLQANRTDRITGTSERAVSLLSGLIFDASGER